MNELESNNNKRTLRESLKDHIVGSEHVGIISLKPKYYELITSGTKRYEYRKISFKSTISKIFIYITKPVSQIRGYIIIEERIFGSPKEIWTITKFESGLNETQFYNYVSNHLYIHAYKIEKFVSVTAFDPFKTTKDFKAPQSIIYF